MKKDFKFSLFALLMFFGGLTLLGASGIVDTVSTTSQILAVSPTDPTTVTDPGAIVDGIKEATSWDQLISWQTAVYTFLFTIGGYISAFVPGLRNIDSGVYRVLVWAILVIAGGLVIGWGNIWGGAVAYFFSTSLYEIVLKWFAPSPRPPEKDFAKF